MCARRKKSMLVSVLAGVCLALAANAHPVSIRGATNLEPPRGGKPYPAIMVPVGGDKLLSRGCPVKGSLTTPDYGEWAMITDGDKETKSWDYEHTTLVKYGSGVQWVQIDLRTSQVVNAVCIWRHHWRPYVYRDVVVQLSDDADFIDGVTTVFNNDHDNSAGLGKGEDKEYIETMEGRPIPVPSIRARYVRVYSNGKYGETYEPANYCTEIEVFGGEATSEEKVQIEIELPRGVFM